MDYFKIEPSEKTDNGTVKLVKINIIKALFTNIKMKPEAKLKIIITKYKTFIVDMINNFYKINLIEQNLFYSKEFSINAGRLDLLFITNYGNILVIELKIKENASNNTITQILRYVRGIKASNSKDIVEKMKKKSPESFEQFMLDNNITEKSLKENVDKNLKINNILSILIYDEFNEKMIEKFDSEITDFKSEISCNLAIGEICCFIKTKNDIIMIPYIHRNICINMEASTKKTINDLYDNLDYVIKNDIPNIINKTLDDINNNNKLELWNDNLKGKNTNDEQRNYSLYELIKSEGIRLKSKSYYYLFKQNDRDKRIPSLSKCSKILGSQATREISIFFKNLNNNQEKIIVEFLQGLAQNLQRTPSSTECYNAGKSISTIQLHFGSYNNALIKAGLTPVQVQTYPTKQDIIDEIIHAFKLVKRNTVREYEKNGAHYYWIKHYFGNLENALKICDIPMC